MTTANPTAKTQKKILKVIEDNQTPLTLSSIAKKTRASIYRVKASVEFLETLGVLKTIVSDSGITFVQIKERDKNEEQ